VTDGRTDRQTDRQTDGIAVANTALAMRALRAMLKIDNTGTVLTMRGQPPPIRQTTVPVLSTLFDQRFQSTKTPVFRSSPGDDLVDWNSGVSVRPSVRPSIRPQKVFPISI